MVVGDYWQTLGVPIDQNTLFYYKRSHILYYQQINNNNSISKGRPICPHWTQIWFGARILILCGLLVTAFVPELGLRCSPEIYPIQLFTMFCFDCFTAIVDFIVAQKIFRSPRAKYYQKKIEQTEEQEVLGTEIVSKMQSSAFEEGNEQIEKNELEFWKFAKRQMSLFVIIGLIWGIFSTVFAAAAHWLIAFPTFNQIFNVKCDEHDPQVWEPHGLPAELYMGAHMMITMMYITLYYVLYWIIPYAYNQVAKTDKEKAKEQKAKERKAERQKERALTKKIKNLNQSTNIFDEDLLDEDQLKNTNSSK
ncbi:hypothetical protein FGO68_gene9819 [Halteria grandinella]|uniref:Transmembrane protein n=1 Tax=Halteria grandinella TaxID=5974 RepID=A0A8J8T812_HALGN|nr:hypothetical protein FGO68_gene9819 [Halteria grandinella]